MEQQTNQGQKLATLLLASSILVAGLVVGGALIVRTNGSEVQVKSSAGGTYSQQQVEQSRSVGRTTPSCGI